MNSFYLMVAFAILMFILGSFWVRQIGYVRGILALLCRVAWTIPIFLAFYPKQINEELPSTLVSQPIHILIDDSKSMAEGKVGTIKTFSETASELQKIAQEACSRVGCSPKVTFLSKLNRKTSEGFTPLNESLDSWLFGVGQNPWVLISDGADSQPTIPWRSEIARFNTASPNRLIYGFPSSDKENVWIDSVNYPPFSFESKALEVEVSLGRSRSSRGKLKVQLQLLAGSKAIGSTNAEFNENEAEITVAFQGQALSRGQHLLSVKVLPTGGEKTLWDNAREVSVEVLPNTVGILHLLGSPSWDGRFLRRYLKSEPKYDIISFFILRDPWDSQAASERELSLIPFPVDRLFNEELQNFRVLIIQNFKLVQFMLPSYQRNLVNFVKEGGGLLFIGGPRALQMQDLRNSPLAEILPFNLKGGTGEIPEANIDLTSGSSRAEPFYDSTREYKIQLAEPSPEKRALASVYDDWESIGQNLSLVDNLKGIHRTDLVDFKADENTPLLNAVLKDKTKLPLANASYPGKGRAIWFFSDQLWKVGMSRSAGSRQVLNNFYQSTMTWLMRKDLRKPLIGKEFNLYRRGSGDVGWSVKLSGPGTKYFQLDKGWTVKICNEAIETSGIKAEKTGSASWVLSGSLKTRLGEGSQCELNLIGEHPAFGSVNLQLAAVYPPYYKDDDMLPTPHKLQKLADLVQGDFILHDGSVSLEKFTNWVEQSSGNKGVALPKKFRTTLEHYWIIDQLWFLILLLFIPLEVVVRRWHRFVG